MPGTMSPPPGMRRCRPSFVTCCRRSVPGSSRSSAGRRATATVRRTRTITTARSGWRIRYLTKRLDSAVLVDPKQQQALRQVFFGATVTYARADGSEHTVTLVGVDEADLAHGKISWRSPVAQALMKAKVDDSVQLRTPSGVEDIE